VTTAGLDISLAQHRDIAAALDRAGLDMLSAGIAEPFLAAMIGNPIAQVKAPGILNPRFEAEGLPVRMVSIEMPRDGFDAAFRGLLSFPDVVAAVITLPFKGNVLKFCRTLDRSAELAGAANLMTRGKDGAWAGAMTDGHGFVSALKSAGFDPIGRRAFMAGAGGAGSGIAAALIFSGLAALDVYDPDRSKVARLEAVLGVTPLPEPPGALTGYDLLINATPLGLQDGDPLPFDPAAADRHAFIGDVIAEPSVTRLRDAAMRSGHVTIGGMDMLKGQIDALYSGVIRAVADNRAGGK